MEKTKHTPGPWKAVSRPVNSTLWRTRVIADECRENIVTDTYTQHYGPGKGESEANAALIAAAPELLEACAEGLHALEQHGDDFHPIIQSHLRAALEGLD